MLVLIISSLVMAGAVAYSATHPAPVVPVPELRAEICTVKVVGVVDSNEEVVGIVPTAPMLDCPKFVAPTPTRPSSRQR